MKTKRIAAEVKEKNPGRNVEKAIKSLSTKRKPGAVKGFPEKKNINIPGRKRVEKVLRASKEPEAATQSKNESREYSESIINTIREPLLILDCDLRVVTASRSFYEFFKVEPEETVGRLVYDLGNRQWDIPRLRELLETILPLKATFENYEVEHDFAAIGRRTMLLNARRIPRPPEKPKVILLAIEDITERKDIQEELKASEERYRRAFETSRDGLFLVHKTEGDILNSNEAAQEFLGYSKEEFLKKKLWGIGLFNNHQDFQAASSRLERDGVMYFDNIPLTTKKGRSVNAEVFLVDKAKVIQCNIRDITERRELEEAHRKLAAIVESTDDAIIAEDFDGIVRSWNKGAEIIYGYPTEEIIGKSISLIMPPDHPDEYKEVLAKIAQGETIKRYETRRRRKDGETINVSLTISPIKDATGKIISAATIASDITERKEIEAGLEKTRKELAVIKKTADEASEFAESVINTVREPLISLDQDLRVVTASRSFYEVFKVKPEETVGQLIYDLGNKQWNIPKLRELLETILPQKATFDNYEVEHVFATIGMRVMLLNARQIQRAFGKERIILLAIEDITENTKLQRDLMERTRDAEKAQAMAEIATRVKSDFLANMSHELRTPLNSIIGFSEVLEDELLGALNTSQREDVQYILKAGRHLLSLINDILDLAKVESGKMRLEVEQVPVAGLLEAMLAMHREKAARHGISLDYQLEPGTDIVIEADERKLKQILFNLLSNAVKFTPDNGSVRVHARKVPNAGGKNDFIEFSVEDTGIGIKAEDIPKLFKEFSQLDSVYDKEYGGTGLGLALTKKLVQLHGGRISVASEFGKGSCFTFVMPIKQVRGKNG